VTIWSELTICCHVGTLVAGGDLKFQARNRLFSSEEKSDTRRLHLANKLS
jgi:hypothetical protein